MSSGHEKKDNLVQIANQRSNLYPDWITLIVLTVSYVILVLFDIFMPQLQLFFVILQVFNAALFFALPGLFLYYLFLLFRTADWELKLPLYLLWLVSYHVMIGYAWHFVGLPINVKSFQYTSIFMLLLCTIISFFKKETVIARIFNKTIELGKKIDYRKALLKFKKNMNADKLFALVLFFISFGLLVNYLINPFYQPGYTAFYITDLNGSIELNTTIELNEYRYYLIHVENHFKIPQNYNIKATWMNSSLLNDTFEISPNSKINRTIKVEGIKIGIFVLQCDLFILKNNIWTLNETIYLKIQVT